MSLQDYLHCLGHPTVTLQCAYSMPTLSVSLNYFPHSFSLQFFLPMNYHCILPINIFVNPSYMDCQTTYYNTLLIPATITNSQSTVCTPCVHSCVKDTNFMAFDVCTAIVHNRNPNKNKGMSHTLDHYNLH